MMLADYVPEAKALDGKIPVLNVVRDLGARLGLAEDVAAPQPGSVTPHGYSSIYFIVRASRINAISQPVRV
jgi:hypothetical protein